MITQGSARKRATLLAGITLTLAMLVTGCAAGNSPKNADTGTASGLSPEPNTSGVPDTPMVKKIVDRGELLVGVLALAPWLVQDTSGGNSNFGGASWTLAEAVAKKLGVKLTPVPVSQQTKVSALSTGTIDISITPLTQTPERTKVLDFVKYDTTADCFAGFGTNPKVAAAINDAKDINNPDLTIAYFVGGAQQPFLPQEFPKAQLKGVTGSGSGVPIEELLSKRVDLIVFNVSQWLALKATYPTLISFPKDCKDSTYQSLPMGWGLAKGDDAFVTYLQSIEKEMEPQLKKEIEAESERMAAQ